MNLAIVFFVSTLTFLLCIVILIGLLQVYKKLDRFTYNHPSWDGLFSLILSNGEKIPINRDTSSISSSISIISISDTNTKIAGLTLHDVPKGKVPRIQLDSKTGESVVIITMDTSIKNTDDVTFVLNIPQDFLSVRFFTDVSVSKYSILQKYGSFYPKRSLYVYPLVVSTQIEKD